MNCWKDNPLEFNWQMIDKARKKEIIAEMNKKDVLLLKQLKDEFHADVLEMEIIK